MKMKYQEETGIGRFCSDIFKFSLLVGLYFVFSIVLLRVIPVILCGVLVFILWRKLRKV